ncbi:hypothetical protein [Methyloceanibacter superfactus]|uniref:hypothetical protein n=1 Tax=Methyloceanibacter superfactus TaxID=1774969 RepID=UPI00114C9442|nr:hypothetical protein [Methyloceanibacter superfactus]
MLGRDLQAPTWKEAAMMNFSDTTSEAPRPSERMLSERISLLACIAEDLTKQRVDEDRPLAAQGNWLAVQIDEHHHDLYRVGLLASIGLTVSKSHLEDDDMLGNELAFVFREIAETATELASTTIKPR